MAGRSSQVGIPHNGWTCTDGEDQYEQLWQRRTKATGALPRHVADNQRTGTVPVGRPRPAPRLLAGRRPRGREPVSVAARRVGSAPVLQVARHQVAWLRRADTQHGEFPNRVRQFPAAPCRYTRRGSGGCPRDRPRRGDRRAAPSWPGCAGGDVSALTRGHRLRSTRRILAGFTQSRGGVGDTHPLGPSLGLPSSSPGRREVALATRSMACTTRTDRPASQPARCSSHTLDTSTAPAPARRRTGRLYDRRALPLFCRTPSRSMRGATVAPCPAARAAGMPRYQGAWLDASCVTSRPRYPRVQPPARSPPPRLRCPVGGGFPPPPTLARSGRRPTGCSAQKRQARSTGYLDRGRRRSCQGRPRGGGSLEFRPGTRCSSSGRLRRRRCSRAWTRRGRPADKSR